MGMTLLRTRIAALTALAWGSACGGSVVVDGMPDGSGGAGATSASAASVSAGVTGTSAASVSVGVTGTSGSWMATSAVTTTATGAGGGDPWSMCVSYCELFRDVCGVGPDGCGSACDEQLALAPGCNDLFVPFFECAMGEVSQCDVSPVECQEHLRQYEACALRPGSDPLGCFEVSDTACRCKGSRAGVDLSVECHASMPTGVFCSCFVGGREVASCEDVGPACDLAQGCCGPIFDALE
ncbi:hypothetical protein [Sorangium sp. So ce1099]|uniref:hypothetical protein n=1 Tax=Sorangium sp. So ce1099 TaxID=3133331 RepID=UPI003F5E6699